MIDPDSRLQVETRRSSAEWTIAVSGELDLASGSALKDAYDLAEASDAERIVVDLSDLDFMDSSGLRAVLSLDMRSRQTGTDLALHKASGSVHRVFVLTKIADRLPFL